MPDLPKTGHRSNKELREALESQVRLISDLASWADLPYDPVHWYVQALRQRVNRACGIREWDRPVR